MKCALKVCIAHLAALTRWLFGSMSMRSQLFWVRKFLITRLAWLSMTFNFILCPFDSRSSNCWQYVARMDLSLKLAMGRANTEFVL